MQKFICKKDIQRLITETASGFQPQYVPSSKPVATAQPTAAPTPIQKAKEPVDYDKVELVKDKNAFSGKEWAKYGGNFPIKRNGKVYWVSRSISVSMYAFCQDKWGNWCILANKRGPGCATDKGKWNVPAGFLNYDETAAEAAGRETWEETGVDIPDNLIKLMGTNTDSETVRMRHSCVLPGTIDDYPVSDENCEPGEVSAIAWIPVLDCYGKPTKEIFKYDWVRNPQAMIDQAYTMLSHMWEPKGSTQGAKNPKERIIWHLRNEIRNNPRANILLDELLKYMQK